MTDIAIRVENLSKLYHIGRAQQRHDTLRDAHLWLQVSIVMSLYNQVRFIEDPIRLMISQ